MTTTPLETCFHIIGGLALNDGNDDIGHVFAGEPPTIYPDCFTAYRFCPMCGMNVEEIVAEYIEASKAASKKYHDDIAEYRAKTNS